MSETTQLSRTQRLQLIAERLGDEPIQRSDAVAWIRSDFGVSKTQAYQDYKDGRGMAGYDGINDQLIVGSLALAAASRCAIECEKIARELKPDGKFNKFQEQRHRLMAASAHAYIALADKCMRLRPTDVMGSDEGRELILRALEQNAPALTDDDLARLEALRKPAGIRH